MSNDKFELTDVYIEINDTRLYRIKALRDFSGVSRDELGGFLEKEENLVSLGNAWVYGDARVSGNAWVSGNARVSGDAWVSEKKGILNIQPIGSEYGTLTAFQDKQGNIRVTIGCYSGTLEEFEEAVKKTHRDNDFAREFKLAIKLIKNRFKA